MMPGLFGWAAGPRMLNDLGAVLDDYRPDVIVHDLAEFAAAAIVTQRSLPHATVAFSGRSPTRCPPAVDESITALWAGVGLEAPDRAGLYEYLYLHPFPPSLGAPPPADSRAARCARSTSTAPRSTKRRSGPRRWGSSAPRCTSRSGRSGRSRGRGNPPRSAGDVRRRRDRDDRAAPRSGLARSDSRQRACRALRTAGLSPGSGQCRRVAQRRRNMLAAVGHGVPQLCVPLGADQWENADALAATGAGRDSGTRATRCGRAAHDPPTASRRASISIIGATNRRGDTRHATAPRPRRRNRSTVGGVGPWRSRVWRTSR